MHELTIVLAVVVSAVALGTTGIAVLLTRNKSLSTTLDFCLNEIALMEEQLERTQEQIKSFETDIRRLSHTGLKKTEKRLQRQSFGPSAVLEPTHQRSSLPEQKTRVIRLAENGSDVDTIAATLGMSPAEVDLILRLNTFAASAA